MKHIFVYPVLVFFYLILIIVALLEQGLEAIEEVLTALVDFLLAELHDD